MKPLLVSNVLCFFLTFAFSPLVLAEESDSETEADEAKETAALQKQLEAPGPVAFLAWMPETPDFTPDGPPKKKIIFDEPHAVQTGTSPRSPEELGDAWAAAKVMSVSRSNSTVNDTKTVTITLSNGSGEFIELEASRAPEDKVTRVKLTSPLPKPNTD